MSNNDITLQFWGVRGTFPVPGKDSVRYGGNTNCISITLPNNELFIFDAGTGIKKLSDHLLETNKGPITAKIFITHPHWDHINGIPFFKPFYIKGNTFEILSATHNKTTVESLIFDQMNHINFPATLKDMYAQISFTKLEETGSLNINEVNIKTHRLNHPGICIGYRIEYNNKSICYITDNELYLHDSSQFNKAIVDQLINFINESDVLIIDATYTDSEYSSKLNWGHSCISEVVNVAIQAKTKLLCLHHHDPNQTDDDIDLKLETANILIKKMHSTTKCIAPHEGDIIIV